MTANFEQYGTTAHHAGYAPQADGAYGQPAEPVAHVPTVPTAPLPPYGQAQPAAPWDPHLRYAQIYPPATQYGPLAHLPPYLVGSTGPAHAAAPSARKRWGSLTGIDIDDAGATGGGFEVYGTAHYDIATSTMNREPRSS